MNRDRWHLRALLAACALITFGWIWAPIAALASPGQPAISPGRPERVSELDLSTIKAPAHRAQIARVVESMDRTGAPPPGVVQGGRRGVFRNAEGLLPRQRLGYWIESDVWPKKGPRGAERLVFGRDREVYWTRDHYQSFVRLR